MNVSKCHKPVACSHVKVTYDMDQNAMSEEPDCNVLWRKPGPRSKDMGVVGSKDRRSFVRNWRGSDGTSHVNLKTRLRVV